MGFVYGENERGNFVLACDVCGHVGGCRKVPCVYGYCQPTAMCSGCRSNPDVRAKHAAFCDDNCKAASENFHARENARRAMRADGAYVRVSALNTGIRDTVAVTFEDADGHIKVYNMSAATYDAIPILEPATPEMFAAHGRVVFRALVS